MKEISVKSAEVLGCEYAGVNIIEPGENPYVVGINAILRWRSLHSTSAENIGRKVVNYLTQY